MNVLFLSISSLPHMSKHSISLDLLHEFQRNGHNVYAVCSIQRGEAGETTLSKEADCTVLRVKTGKNKKANLIEKGLTALTLPYIYKSAIKKYLPNVKFDLILYPTPPVTHVDTVRYIKKRDGAKSYLVLKDIFPQNAVDLGMMRKSGIKGIIYHYFRRKEKQLYALSDRIGCMSEGNCRYVIKHNPEIDPTIVEVCPNSIEVQDLSLNPEEKILMRKKYNMPLDKKVFVYGGNLGKPQGIPFLMDCLKAQKDNGNVFFLIIGNGTEYEKLNNFIDREGFHNVKLMDRLPKEDYDRMVAACDVGLIFLDHRFTIPNFPSRLLSYMQAGLPVLACTDPNTDVGEVIVNGGFGWWCESNDVQKFEEMVRCAQTADLQTMGNAAQKYLQEKYSVSQAYKTIQVSVGLE